MEKELTKCIFEINLRSHILIKVCIVLAYLLHLVYYVDCMECGQVNVINDLVIGGNRSVVKRWSFVAVIHQINHSEYLCGGSLISKKHVLTAAHCIQKKNSPKKLLPHELVVRLGVYNLTAIDEEGAVRANVEEIYVNSYWNPYRMRFDADIAILVLSQNITITNEIRPICMPADSVEIDSATIDVNGTIIGWGFSENKIYEEIAKEATIIAINDTFCYTLDRGMASFSSNRTFCGGFGDGIPNSGDSGGGFYVESDNIWVQYGVVSAISTNEVGDVLPDSIAIFTNVRSFKNWIVETVRSTGGVVSEAIIKINLICRYGSSPQYQYVCQLNNLDIRKENVEVASVIGFHKNGNKNENVESLHFLSRSMVALPNGIGNILKNLKNLQLRSNLGTRFIKKLNFQNMTNLVDLYLLDNEIGTLEEDSLWDLPNLETFQLQNNTLKELSEHLFERNGKLKVVNINTNKMLETLPENVFQNNPLLESVTIADNSIREIDEKIFERNFKLKSIQLQSNKLESVPKNLLKNNSLLEDVSFDSNSLRAIDEDIFENNRKLKIVYLSSNQLDNLPRNLFRNKFLLDYVRLENNSLQTIDEHIFETNENLNTLGLWSNRLKYLPNNLFKNNFLLRNLDLKDNQLKKLDKCVFSANSNLNIILLSGNQLEFLPVNLFRNNSFLQYLNLSGNILQTINEEIFQQNPFLMIIDLSSNRLEFLSKNLFKKNLLLQIINFNDNFLRIIEFDLTKLNVGRISFINNICINRTYVREDGSDEFENLMEFQRLLTADCGTKEL